MKLSIKQQVIGLQDRLSEEFETHAIVILCTYNDLNRHLQFIIDYPLSDRQLIFPMIVPTKKTTKFFKFLEDDLKRMIYEYIKQWSMKYGYHLK